MVSELGDAIGTASEGALLSKAVASPQASEGSGAMGHFHEQACLNCGTALVGPHCHTCGQQAHLHRSIGAFLHDLFHGVLHFEGRTWRTLPMLAFRPGQLTRRYIDGERRRFVTPMALFLFSVFLMFAVFSALGLTPSPQFGEGGFFDQVESAREETVRERDQAQAALDRLPEGAQERAALQRKIADANETLEGMKVVNSVRSNGGTLDDISVTGIEAIDKGLVGKWRANPSLMLYKLQSNGYKYSWLLIPLSIPFMWLLFFWKRRFGGYDHAVFVTYSLAFMSLLFVALSVAGMAGVPSALIALAAVFVPPLHIYKHLRGTYALTRVSALWRLIALSLFIWVVVALFLQILLLLGTT